MPQKEASPFLDKKIDELEVKLADMEDADDDMEDMDDEEEAPETPSMPQMQTPLASDIDIMPYTPSQVPRHLKHAQIQRCQTVATNIKINTKLVCNFDLFSFP